MTYFITFAYNGAHLHGEESGSVDRNHNIYRGLLADVSPTRADLKGQQMDQTPYTLDHARRKAVLKGIREV